MKLQSEINDWMVVLQLPHHPSMRVLITRVYHHMSMVSTQSSCVENKVILFVMKRSYNLINCINSQ